MYKTDGAAAMDVIATVSHTLHQHSRVTIGTGLVVEFPEGLKINVIPRSGLAHKEGITVLNSPGLIDHDYRGEIGIIVINHGAYPFEIVAGERIAQIEVAPVYKIKWNKVESVESLAATDRGAAGFGSTGRKS